MLEPGTIIKIKSGVEIDKTLDANKCCKEVLFTQDMYQYCGYTCSIAGYNSNGTYQVNEEGPKHWNWLPEWFDVIQKPNDFWNGGSKEQRSLCLGLYRQALSGNMPCIHKLNQNSLVFKIKDEGGFNYASFFEDEWENKVANNLPNWKWLNVKPRILERAFTILYNGHRHFEILERNPNNPGLWFDGVATDAEDVKFIADFISNYLDNSLNTTNYEDKLQRKKSDLVRGTVPEGNIICGRKRKTSISIGYLSNKICSGI